MNTSSQRTERDRPKREPPQQTARAADRLAARLRTTTFYYLPHEVLKAPPIRHRNGRPKDGVTVFEFALAAAVGLLVRLERGEEAHDYAWPSGKEAIDKRRSKLDRERARRERQRNIKRKRERYDPGYDPDADGPPTDHPPRYHQRRRHWDDTHYTVAGRQGYATARAEYDKLVADDKLVDVEVTRANLLRAMAVPRKGANYAALPAALQRLTQPVDKFPPPLERWDALPDGRLHLHVHPFWVPEDCYELAPSPLPTSGPTVLALYLFCLGADTRPGSDTTIAVEALCKLIGIPAAHARRALTQALQMLNRHLGLLGVGGRLQALCRMTSSGIKYPAEYFDIFWRDSRRRLQIAARSGADLAAAAAAASSATAKEQATVEDHEADATADTSDEEPMRRENRG
jgi:hypothetical protein